MEAKFKFNHSGGQTPELKRAQTQPHIVTRSPIVKSLTVPKQDAVVRQITTKYLENLTQLFQSQKKYRHDPRVFLQAIRFEVTSLCHHLLANHDSHDCTTFTRLHCTLLNNFSAVDPIELNKFIKTELLSSQFLRRQFDIDACMQRYPSLFSIDKPVPQDLHEAISMIKQQLHLLSINAGKVANSYSVVHSKFARMCMIQIGHAWRYAKQHLDLGAARSKTINSFISMMDFCGEQISGDDTHNALYVVSILPIKEIHMLTQQLSKLLKTFDTVIDGLTATSLAGHKMHL